MQAGTGAFVLEASKGGCTPDASCIASYLLNAVEYTYLGCLADEPTFNGYVPVPASGPTPSLGACCPIYMYNRRKLRNPCNPRRPRRVAYRNRRWLACNTRYPDLARPLGAPTGDKVSIITRHPLPITHYCVPAVRARMAISAFASRRCLANSCLGGREDSSAQNRRTVRWRALVHTSACMRAAGVVFVCVCAGWAGCARLG